MAQLNAVTPLLSPTRLLGFERCDFFRSLDFLMAGFLVPLKRPFCRVSGLGRERLICCCISHTSRRRRELQSQLRCAILDWSSLDSFLRPLEKQSAIILTMSKKVILYIQNLTSGQTHILRAVANKAGGARSANNQNTPICLPITKKAFDDARIMRDSPPRINAGHVQRRRNDGARSCVAVANSTNANGSCDEGRMSCCQ